jgi:hypothetical protein
MKKTLFLLLMVVMKMSIADTISCYLEDLATKGEKGKRMGFTVDEIVSGEEYLEQTGFGLKLKVNYEFLGSKGLDGINATFKSKSPGDDYFVHFHMRLDNFDTGKVYMYLSKFKRTKKLPAVSFGGINTRKIVTRGEFWGNLPINGKAILHIKGQPKGRAATRYLRASCSRD